MTETSDKAQIASAHAHDAAASAHDRAGEVTAHAQDAAHQVAGTATEQAQHVKTETVRQARNLAGEATGQLSSQAKDQTQRLTAALRQLGDELKGMADGGQPGGTATELAHQGSERVHSLASYLDGKESAEILNNARGFARRRPGAFLAGAAVLGLLAGRVGRGVKDAHTENSNTGDASDVPAGVAAPTYQTTRPLQPAPVIDLDEPAAGGFTSSTSHFTTQDPHTGALLPDHGSLSGHAVSDQEES